MYVVWNNGGTGLSKICHRGEFQYRPRQSDKSADIKYRGTQGMSC